MRRGGVFHGNPPSAKSVIPHHHFDVSALAPHRQLLGWRERVGHVIDVLPSRADLEKPFNVSIDRNDVGDLVTTDC
jgi:hypothetical protein